MFKNCVSKSNEKGFSLVELMIVVGIIGVLATLALPRFKQFQAKAKMGEARTMLAHLYTLQQTYSLDNNTYIVMAAIGRPAGGGALTVASCTVNAGAAALGFRIDPCVAGGATPRYSYSVVAGGAGIQSEFLAAAATGAGANNAVCPGNPLHTVNINEANVIAGTAAGAAVANVPDVGVACPD